tara:strand:+ start:637 stop:1863 length:1227 start_codon:yes stop_codon:yes gene_type:complete
MRLFKKLFKIILLIPNLFYLFSKILLGKKKNIFFIEGGFGVISTHCHLISLLDKKDNLMVWVVKDEFNPIEMINFWRQKLDVLTLKLPVSKKKIILKIIEKLISFFGKNYFDLFSMEKKFILNKKIDYEELEIKNKNLIGENYNFYNPQNLKKNIIFRTPFLLLIKEIENSNIPIFDKNKIKIRNGDFNLNKDKLVLVYIRYRAPSSTTSEGISRNGSNLKDFEKSIKYLNNHGYTFLLNGDYDYSHLDYLKDKGCKIFSYKDFDLNLTEFYIFSALNSSFGICEYGGGIPLMLILKKKLLLINFFPISHGYPNSLIHPKICTKKNYKNIDELFVKNSFIEDDPKGNFRVLNQNEIYDAVYEFYNDFLFKEEIKKHKLSTLKSSFSYYFKNSTYAGSYIKNQEKYFEK